MIASSPRLRERVKRLIPRSLVVRNLGAVTRPMLLLTFDDGPDAEVTPKVLDRLETHDARAVFFVVGRRAAAHPTVVREIHARGHRLGNHTYEHRNDRDPWFLEYLRDVRRCQQLVTQSAGVAPDVFRPPKGHLSLTSLAVPKLLGLQTINWSVNVQDWACRTSDQALRAARELEELAGPGHIVLLHDDNPRVLDVLDYVLPRFRDRGYDLKTAAALL